MRQRINPQRETVEERLLNIVEYFIGMRPADTQPRRGPSEGFSRPEPRPASIPITDFSLESEEAEDARWAHEAGLITKAQLEQELAKAGFDSSFIEFDKNVT